MNDLTNISSDWNDDNWIVFGEWLRSMLRHNTVTVTFTKSDGAERVMRCTLQSQYLPSVSLAEGKTRKTNDNTLSVWDLEVSAWRSFRLRSVSSVKLILTTSE